MSKNLDKTVRLQSERKRRVDMKGKRRERETRKDCRRQE